MSEIEPKTLNAKEIYEAHKAKLKDTLNELRNAARNYFKEAVKALFDAHPVLESFGWTQYTPYWNDGEQCHFGVHDLCFVKGNDGTDSSEDDDDGENAYWLSQGKRWNPQTKKMEAFESPLSQAAKEASKLIRSISKQDMESMFGDHVKVIVTKDNIVTEEYDHE